MISSFSLRSKTVTVRKGQYIETMASGCESIFIQISKRIGLKLFYKNLEAAKRSLKRQRKASRYGLAPRVLSSILAYKFTINHRDIWKLDKRNVILAEAIFEKDIDILNYPRDDTFTMYGYKTEVVQMTHPLFRKTMNRMDDLRDSLTFYVFPEHNFDDLYGNNCGWLKDRLVAIDFGDASV